MGLRLLKVGFIIIYMILEDWLTLTWRDIDCGRTSCSSLRSNTPQKGPGKELSFSVSTTTNSISLNSKIISLINMTTQPKWIYLFIN